MSPQDLLTKIEQILEQSEAAVLGTSDSRGRCHMRWMVVITLPDTPGRLYTFTDPASAKIGQIEEGSKAEWMLQSADFSEVINLRGAVNIIDRPWAEVVEAMEDRLKRGWHPDIDLMDLVVLETVIDTAVYSRIREGTIETIHINGKWAQPQAKE